MLVLLSLLLSGCGSGVVRGRIAGKVTLQGKPVTQGLVLFANSTNGINMSADLKPDGTYEILTAEGIGLPVGTYQVCVCPPLMQATTGVDTTPKVKQASSIPPKYRRYKSSELTLTVKQGENPFDIEMKP